MIHVYINSFLYGALAIQSPLWLKIYAFRTNGLGPFLTLYHPMSTKVRAINETDDRQPISSIFKDVDIFISIVHCILNHIFKTKILLQDNLQDNL